MALPEIFVGIDVAATRGCALAVIAGNGCSKGTAWIECDVALIVDYCEALNVEGTAAVAIDAPRRALELPRLWYWSRAAANWRERTAEERGHGRHCEVVVSALGLANPQWSPFRDAAPPWMRLGFEIYQALGEVMPTFEVFPSATYSQLKGIRDIDLSLPVADLARGPKDILDAYISAWTLREYLQGRGQAVGGGDELGEIILARPISLDAPPALISWPTAA